ncbi:IS91 family transposase [Chitinispirillales bacterium ANBcel5]|uniref:IS91 family transposase n=1 Tax=Cellulosispirillum alkaliphilum TaxID=3039283 RepID=UPI002A56C940|nr:IS91 family transposase [Chitinispirillales bacterium ANBcel5]
MKTTIKLADIFSASLQDYIHKYGKLPLEHSKAVNAIMNCRTETMGYHQYECESCHEPQTHFHSCRNRHCPHCQGYSAMQWVQARVEEMLPVSYFHAVFTVPSELNPFVLRNKKVMYSLLFRAVKDTLNQLAAQEKWLGAKIGFIAVLHTWGQKLTDHPHLHCIIPAGGLRLKDNRWKHCRNNFFVHIEVIKQVYRGKFIEYFKHAVATGVIKYYGVLEEYTHKHKLNDLISLLYRKEWVVYIKPSFASPKAVLNYLGNYTHRIAISEKRILSFKDGKVTFTYTDYRNDCKRKVMTLSAVEFIRRLLLHILPSGFMRIRHFGLFANRDRTEHINLCRKLLGEYALAAKETLTCWWEQILQRTGKHPLICSKCNAGLLQLVFIMPPGRRSVMVT